MPIHSEAILDPNAINPALRRSHCLPIHAPRPARYSKTPKEKRQSILRSFAHQPTGKVNMPIINQIAEINALFLRFIFSRSSLSIRS